MEMERWELLDRKLSTCWRLAEEQRSILAEMQSLVSSAPILPKAGSGSPCSLPTFCPEYTSLGQLPGSHTFSESSTVPKDDMASIVPKMTMQNHANKGSSDQPGWGTREAHIPPIAEGVFPWARARVAQLVNSPVFEPAMAFVIGVNAVNIGVAIDLELRGMSTEVSSAIEVLLVAIFTLELLLRVAARGLRSLLNFSTALDSFVIVLTFVTMFIKPLLTQGKKEEQIDRVLDQIMILRMARLLRLTRLISCVESLWKLAHGLLRCVGTMGSACILMFITLYLFACFGAELIAKPHRDDPAVEFILREHFATMPKIFLTLFQFVSMDSTAGIYFPLVEHSPALAIYFWLLLMIVPIALLNLITAILVEDVISTVQADETMKQIQQRRQLKQLTPALKELFRRLDTSNDGHITIKEVTSAIAAGMEIPEALQGVLNPARMLDLFDALDADSSGDLSESEFIEGLTYASMSDVAIETIQMLHLMRTMKQDLERLSPPAYRRPTCRDANSPSKFPACLDASEVTHIDSEGALAI